MKEIRSEGVVFALISWSAFMEEEEDNNSKEAQSALVEFSNLMLHVLPEGLPFIREIQHQIDLISGSSLPNKETYKFSLKEAEKLQRQVEELLEKRYIQESISPYVALKVFVLKNDGS